VQCYSDVQEAAACLQSTRADLVLFVLDGRTTSPFEVATTIRKQTPQQRVGFFMTDSQCPLFLDDCEIHAVRGAGDLIDAVEALTSYSR
jgi:DNA-binding LytR/AlgR family response regulator